MKQFINVKGRILAVTQIHTVMSDERQVTISMAQDVERFYTNSQKESDELFQSISKALDAVDVQEVVSPVAIVATPIDNGWRTFDEHGQPTVDGKYEALYEGDTSPEDSKIRIRKDGIWRTEDNCGTLFGSYPTEGESYRFIEPLENKIYHIGRDGQPKQPGTYNIFYKNDDSASSYRQLYFNGRIWTYSEEHQSPTGFGNVSEDWNIGLGERYSKVV
jgi:hypothetical protein